MHSRERPASTDMGPCIENGVGPDAADDTRDVPPHRPNVYVTDVRKVAPRSQAKNAPSSQAKATIRRRPNDEMHSRPITRTGLRSISDDPCRPTWGHASEMVSAQMPLTTRETRYHAARLLRYRRSKGGTSLAGKERAFLIASESDDPLAPERWNA